ncbi:MAG: hypothetical protein QXI45_00180 [Thermofilaceae archaeon]
MRRPLATGANPILPGPNPAILKALKASASVLNLKVTLSPPRVPAAERRTTDRARRCGLSIDTSATRR